jgi:uncharacterized protein involved in type VI secretion and phage assembly
MMDDLFDARLPRGPGARFYGVYPAIVTDLQDPDGQGRVKVRLPWSIDGGDASFEAWARLATMMAGNDRGSFFLPDVEDEVLVSFGSGDPRQPFVVGALWNGRDAPPERVDRQNTKKVLRSRNGVTVTLDDTEAFVVRTPGGRTVSLRDGDAAIVIEDGAGNSIKLESTGISIKAAAEVKVEGAMVKVSAAMVTVDAGMSTFSGVVKCDTLITNAVVSSSYTPGAGNVW